MPVPALHDQVRATLATLCERATGYDVVTHVLLMEAFNEFEDIRDPNRFVSESVLGVPPDQVLDELLSALTELIDITSDEWLCLRYSRVRALVQAARTPA
jgi:hypothetical protein